jgi:hypothetical protein
LLIGAILCPVERTVTAVLRVMGLSGEKYFQDYLRVLNQAFWSSLEASHILFGLLIHTFALRGQVILGLDDTIGTTDDLTGLSLAAQTVPSGCCRQQFCSD